MIYYVNEAAFELPDVPTVDRTVNVLEMSTADGRELGVLIARSPLPRGKSLLDVVRAHQDHERRKLRGWSTVFERQDEVDGAPAVELGVRWRGDDGMVYQRQAHLGLGDEVLLFIVNGDMDEREACDACMDRLLRTLKLRTER
jgi:hypothetical protein